MTLFNHRVPVRGYILPLWDSAGDYRATALAYMQREDVKEVKNSNGKTYSLETIKKAML